MTLNKQALRVPERKRHNWSQAVMRDCDFCSQWSLTVKHENGGCICASCCDAEYTSELKCALEVAIDRADAAEKRIAELEAMRTQRVMFIDGDISPDDADKLAAAIRDFNEETEGPAARMARIIRENPHPTNMCDMPAAGIKIKGE